MNLLQLHRRRPRPVSTPPAEAPREYIPLPSGLVADGWKAPEAGYSISSLESSDLPRFVADANARGYDVALQQWDGGTFGGFADLYITRRSDNVTVPLDGSVIYSFGPRFWDEFVPYVEAEAALARRAALQQLTSV